MVDQRRHRRPNWTQQCDVAGASSCYRGQARKVSKKELNAKEDAQSLPPQVLADFNRDRMQKDQAR